MSKVIMAIDNKIQVLELEIQIKQAKLNKVRDLTAKSAELDLELLKELSGSENDALDGLDLVEQPDLYKDEEIVEDPIYESSPDTTNVVSAVVNQAYYTESVSKDLEIPAPDRPINYNDLDLQSKHCKEALEVAIKDGSAELVESDVWSVTGKSHFDFVFWKNENDKYYSKAYKKSSTEPRATDLNKLLNKPAKSVKVEEPKPITEDKEYVFLWD